MSTLDPDQPLPMRAMASALCCDASMATWLVDRLEELGLAERRTPPSDRRVKTIELDSSSLQAPQPTRRGYA